MKIIISNKYITLCSDAIYARTLTVIIPHFHSIRPILPIYAKHLIRLYDRLSLSHFANPLFCTRRLLRRSMFGTVYKPRRQRRGRGLSKCPSSSMKRGSQSTSIYGDIEIKRFTYLSAYLVFPSSFMLITHAT